MARITPLEAALAAVRLNALADTVAALTVGVQLRLVLMCIGQLLKVIVFTIGLLVVVFVMLLLLILLLFI